MKINKNSKTTDVSVDTQILNNMDRYIKDLASSSTQTDGVISFLIENKDSLTPEQQNSLRKQIVSMMKNDMAFYSKMGIACERSEAIHKILGDKK